MEIEMTGKIDMNELMSELSTLVIKEQYIDSELIEAWVTGWLNDNLQSHLVDSLNIENEIMEFMHNEDLSDYIDIQSHIDTCDIRYDIEDDILEQVNDHLDYDSIKYNIEDDIIESVEESVRCNFDIDDHIDYDDIKSNCEIDELEDRVEALESQVEALQASFDEFVENPPRKVGLIRRILGWLW